MSGTSLDGIDLAWCDFTQNEDGRWHYAVRKAETFPYDNATRDALAHASDLTALEYCNLNNSLGEIIANHVVSFIGNNTRPDFIASHGHTVFHQPSLGLTTQIGSGAVIAARTGITTVNDFRVVDVALHGQGAPLVPIGDELLFGEYDACLNLGGFSNISFHEHNLRIAFDISPCNMALNFVARALGLDYDNGGNIAQSGQSIPQLRHALDQIEYYQHEYPKSLGKEWFETIMQPILLQYMHTPKNTLRTLSEHIAFQITRCIPTSVTKMLVTGGGALNHFLIQQIREQWNGQVCIPNTETILFKEAIIFAFLGLLRLQGTANTLSSVTGAKLNSCGGCIWTI